MTIPEAIAELIIVRDYIDKNDFYRGEEKVEALDMAMDALRDTNRFEPLEFLEPMVY